MTTIDIITGFAQFALVVTFGAFGIATMCGAGR